MRRAILVLLLAVTPSTFGSFWWDYLPPPPTGPSAGKGGGFWVLDFVTEGFEVAKTVVAESLVNIQKKAEEKEDEERKAAELLKKQIGEAMEGTPVEIKGIDIDLGGWEARRALLGRITEDPNREPSGVENYLSFSVAHEKRLLVYTARLKALEAAREKKLGWEEHLQVATSIGLLQNNLLLEEIRQQEAAASARMVERTKALQSLQRSSSAADAARNASSL